MSQEFKNKGPIYTTKEKYEAMRTAGTLESGREYRIVDWEAQEKLVAGTGITIGDDGKTISASTSSNKNAYNYIKQIADYLFEVQYSTENVDYAYANEYFSQEENAASGGACTGIVKDGQVLRHFDYFYDNNVEFIIRRPADPENDVYGSIAVGAGYRSLSKELVESGAYSELYKIVPFATSDGINDQGLYIQQNVVPKNGIEYNLNSTSSVECCATMLPRYILDYCASFDDIDDVLTSVHIYSNPKLDFGNHFLIAKGNEWRVLELTADSYNWVTQGTGTNQMPNGIMTNFRTTGLTFTNGAIDWSSVEDYGLGVERYDIATTMFGTSAPSWLELRRQLKYSHLYADATQTWKTELSGEEVGGEGSHKLTVMDAKGTEYADVYVTKFAAEKAAYDARTRADGQDTWHTVHSALYDLNKGTFNLLIQERMGDDDKSYDFSLEDLVGSIQDVQLNGTSVVSSGIANVIINPNPTTATSDPLLESVTIGTQKYRIPAGGSGGTVDDELSPTSTNPVQNKLITDALGYKASYKYVNDKFAELEPEEEYNISSEHPLTNRFLTDALGYKADNERVNEVKDALEDQIDDTKANLEEQINTLSSTVATKITNPSDGQTGYVLTKTETSEAWQKIKALPDGGTYGQVLTKSIDDAEWTTINVLPSGGSTGQVLTKTSTGEAWQSVPTELPSSGTTGQYLQKNGSSVVWADVNALPSGGSVGQVLTKTSSGESWQNVPTEIPSAGTIGYALRKTADGYDWLSVREVPTGTTEEVGKVLKCTGTTTAAWDAINEVPSTGTTGYYLQKTDNGYAWQDVTTTLEAAIEAAVNAYMQAHYENGDEVEY